MTNDQLSAIDAALSRGEGLDHETAKALREQLALVAARAVRRNAEMVNAAPLETVICAAIRLPDGRVIRGHRHDGCILYAKAMVDYEAKPGNGAGSTWHPSMCREQGFVTSRNRYVDRYEGMRLQIAAGLIADGRSGQQLFSEDLY
jgi:hypothetical protein